MLYPTKSNSKTKNKSKNHSYSVSIDSSNNILNTTPNNINISLNSKDISNLNNLRNSNNKNKLDDWNTLNLIERLSVAIKVRYNAIFNEKGYTIPNLINDLENMIYHLHLNNMIADYDNCLEKFCKEIYNKVNKLKSKTVNKLLSKVNKVINKVTNKVNDNNNSNDYNNNDNNNFVNRNIITNENLLSLPNINNINSRDKSLDHKIKSKDRINRYKNQYINTEANEYNNYKNYKKYNNIDKDDSNNLTNDLNLFFNKIEKLNPKNIKLKELKIRESDIWGKAAKDEYQNLLEDKAKRKKIKIETSEVLKNTLDQQSKEKIERDREYGVYEDRKYIENLQELNREFELKQKERYAKSKEKEIALLNHQKLSAQSFSKSIEKEKELEKQILYQQSLDIEKDNLKKKKKKEEYKLNVKQQEQLEKYRGDLSQMEKMENLYLENKKQQEYEDLINKQNKDREDIKNNIRQRFFKNLDFIKLSKFYKEVEDKKSCEEDENRKYLQEKKDMEEK